MHKKLVTLIASREEPIDRNWKKTFLIRNNIAYIKLYISAVHNLKEKNKTTALILIPRIKKQGIILFSELLHRSFLDHISILSMVDMPFQIWISYILFSKISVGRTEDEPRILHMLGKHYTAELYSRPEYLRASEFHVVRWWLKCSIENTLH